MASDSEIEDISIDSLDSTEIYSYVSVPDNGAETFNIANQVQYTESLMVLIFALGILSGLFFGWVSSWRN